VVVVVKIKLKLPAVNEEMRRVEAVAVMDLYFIAKIELVEVFLLLYGKVYK